MGYPKQQLLVALCVYFGQILVGYGMGWTAPVILKLQDPEQSPLQNGISEREASWIGSMFYVGSIIGPYVSGFLSNLVGRKPCLFLGGALFFLAFLLLALARNLAVIFAGRILVGFGTGIVFVVNLMYIGEIASTHIRGILLTITAIFNILGTFIVYSVGPYVSYSATSYLGAALSFIYFFGLFYIPETPLFLAMKGDEEKVKDTLTFLGRADDIDLVMSSKNKITSEINSKKDWFEVFTVNSNRKALFITLTLNVLQQMSGVIVVIFYATTIFELADSIVDPHKATIIMGVTPFLGSCVTPFLVERAGRKSLLLVSTAACCLNLGVLGTYFYLSSIDSELAANAKWLPLVTLIIFFLSYDLGLGIIPGTFIGEMFTSNVRSTGSTLTITIAWLFGFGITTSFGYMLVLGPHFAFWFYASACATAFVFTIVFVPETKGKSLMEIQNMLS